MIKKILLSFIIPVYNCEKYLERCVSSILDSIPFEFSYEILLINDGSIDGSKQICERLEASNSNILLISQENKGASTARNVGLENSSGKFIWFVDADDMISGEDLRIIIRTLYDESYDLIVFNHYVESSSGKTEVVNYSMDAQISGYEYLERNEALYLWNKIYSREAIAETRFLDGTKNLEDFLFNINVIADINKIKQLSIFGYVYNSLNLSSTSRNRSLRNLIKLSQDTYKVHAVLINEVRNGQFINVKCIEQILNCSIAGHLFSLMRYYNAKQIYNAIGWYKDRGLYPIRKTCNIKANLFIFAINSFVFRFIVLCIIRCNQILDRVSLPDIFKFQN